MNWAEHWRSIGNKMITNRDKRYMEAGLIRTVNTHINFANMLIENGYSIKIPETDLRDTIRDTEEFIKDYRRYARRGIVNKDSAKLRIDTLKELETKLNELLIAGE